MIDDDHEVPVRRLRLAEPVRAFLEANVCDCPPSVVSSPVLVNDESRSVCQRCWRVRPRLDEPHAETADEHTERMRARFANGQGSLEPLVTDRGFRHLLPVSSTYGGHVRVYESSAASGPHVWVTSVAPSDLNDPTSPAVEVALHLTLEGAATLSDQLAWLVEHHYQVRDADDADDDR